MATTLQPETGLPAAGFDRAAFEQFLSGRTEPDWLTEHRRAAFDRFEAIPLPIEREELWRHTDLCALGFSFDQYRVSGSAPAADDRQAMAELGERAGVAVLSGDRLTHSNLDSALEKQGVYLGSIHDALARTSGDLRDLLTARGVPPGTGKFQAFHAAFWPAGVFLHLPKDAQIELPLHVAVQAHEDGAAVLPRIVIHAEAGSRATVILRYHGAAATAGLCVSQAELALEPGAKVRFTSLQQWGGAMRHFAHYRAYCAEKTELRSLVAALGGGLSRVEVESLLEGEHSLSEMLGLYFATAEQHLDFRTLQSHLAPHTTSDLLYKGALKDAARSVYAGLIKVHPGAQKTDAYQANRNLVLGGKARADSMPKLEIEANDVRCTHGATVGKVDPEQMFFLQCRGLPRLLAERLLVMGFYQQVLERIPEERLRGVLLTAVTEKLGI